MNNMTRCDANYPIIDAMAEAASTLTSTFLNTLDTMVDRIAVQIIITAPLFYLHHNLFALGFAAGFIFDRQVQEVVEKVNVVYNAERSLLERILFISSGILLPLLTMPTSIVIATLYYSAQWGALLYKSSLGRQRAEEAR